jgi:hypothetical protein
MHFSQLCTHERCKGYWAFRFDEGMFGDVSQFCVPSFDTADTARTATRRAESYQLSARGASPQAASRELKADSRELNQLSSTNVTIMLT